VISWKPPHGYTTSATPPTFATTGLHALDGARYLRDAQHADAMLCRLVAYQSCAIIESGERGLRTCTQMVQFCVSRLSWLEIASEAIACSRSPPAASSAKRYPAAAATGRWHNRAPGWGMIGSVAVTLAPHSPVAVTIVQSESRPARGRMPRGRGRR